MGKYKVVEKFVSINGEARCAGELAVFIRFAGCNLNYEYIKDSKVRNVTLTGGEPLLQENIKRLITLLSKDKNLRIEIETNGAIRLDEFIGIGENVTFTVDYKLPKSGMESKMELDNYRLLRDIDTVKFVVSDYEDLVKTKEIIKKYRLDERLQVYISACFGKIKNEDIVKFMIENKMNLVRLQLQIHKYIWSPDKKGV